MSRSNGELASLSLNAAEVYVGAGGLRTAGTLTAAVSVVIAGSTAWHAGNDGAGSGMDADLLDGQHGTYFRDLTNSTGTLPNARMSGTYDGLTELGAQRIRLTSTTDGSETSTGHAFQIGPTNGQNLILDNNEIISRDNGERSGLNLISSGVYVGGAMTIADGATFGAAFGRDAQFTLDLFSSNPIINFSTAGNITYSRALNELWLTVGGAIRASLTTTNLFLFGNKAWHAGNDGAGSGMDADLLDGFQAAAFLRDIGSSLAQTGYMKLSNGLILQWGSVAGTYSADTDISVTYPVAFPNATFVVVGSNSDVFAQKNAVLGVSYSPPPLATSFKWRTNVAGQNRLNWIAIGN